MDRPGAQHDDLADHRGHWQHQPEGRALARLGLRLDAATHRIDIGADHIHADTATGQLGDDRLSRQPRCEDQLAQIGFGQFVLGLNQPHADGLLADTRQIQTGPVIRDLDADFIAVLARGDRHLPQRILARRDALLGRFDAVRHTVAQQMLEGRHHAIEHAAVDTDRAAVNIEPDLLAGLLACQTDQPVEAVGDAIELDHAGSQQITLQLARQPSLGSQLVFNHLQGTLQRAAHRGHVVDRLGHHSRQLLQTGVAIHLQRVEGLVGDAIRLHARLHLSLGLHGDVVELPVQPLQVVRQIDQRAAQLPDFGLDPATVDVDFTGQVDQPIEQLRLDPNRLHIERGALAATTYRVLDGARESRPVDRCARGQGGGPHRRCGGLWPSLRSSRCRRGNRRQCRSRHRRRHDCRRRTDRGRYRLSYRRLRHLRGGGRQHRGRCGCGPNRRTAHAVLGRLVGRQHRHALARHHAMAQILEGRGQHVHALFKLTQILPMDHPCRNQPLNR